MSGTHYYIPGQTHSFPSPISRYLPPLPPGQVSTWLTEHFPEGSWILDPFGSTPGLVVEAARAGYKVVVAVNNPILRLLLELEAETPTEAEMRASLAELSASYKGDQRVEPHIRSLYQTHCNQCRGTVEVDCFLWEKAAAYPYARIYTCPNCGDSGERATLPEDHEKALEYSDSGLHKARALERVAPKGDPDREHALDALSVYLPRAIYALFTLINKLNALSLPAAKRQHLDALMLYACDRANTLWPHPTQRERPRQLTIPPKFRENNLWLALEEAVRLFGSRTASAVPLVTWPAGLSSEAGILLFHGRLKELEEKQKDFQCKAAFAAVPRPNQAFWTLSALWSGWLWGRESASPIKTVLRRRRYDWGWHSGALSAVFSHLHPLLEERALFLSLFGETEPGMLSAALTAGSWNGFDIEGIALRAEESRTQVHFKMTEKTGEPELPESIDKWVEAARKAAQDYLKERGQPSPYLSLHAAGLTSIVKGVDHHPKRDIKPTSEESLRPIDYFNQIQSAIREALTFRGGFLRFEGSSQNPESGQWWLKNHGSIEGDKHLQPPLADRIEKAVVQKLISQPVVSKNHLEQEMCKTFPGLLTPNLSFLTECLISYAYKESTESNDWRLKGEDNPQARWKDLKTTRQAVVELGGKLGYMSEKVLVIPSSGVSTQIRSSPIAWLDSKGNFQYIFYFIASAIISSILDLEHTAKMRVLVFPAERSALLSHKLNLDPRLMEAIKDGWKFMNFQQAGQLLENPLTTRKSFAEILSNLPVVDSETQMRLL